MKKPIKNTYRVTYAGENGKVIPKYISACTRSDAIDIFVDRFGLKHGISARKYI